MSNLSELSREVLIGMLDDFAKNWLAHDGLWFQAVEKRNGMDLAMDCDREAWESFSRIEAKRIMKRHNILKGSGLEGLKRALGYRLYARLNKQEFIEEQPDSFIFRMRECRVQLARERKGLPDFPCKSVGIVEYTEFAKTIDAKIITSCLSCPPDQRRGDFYCAWNFSLPDE
ncbi:MAG: hypothetical protein HQ508_06040 [Candidatus Marinimicrobia bacterium]|nr:hypothetical protein [Candidatus Neomarinimicrobiota bacterium]